MDPSSVSAIQVDGVISMHSQILLFIHDLEMLGNFLFNESIVGGLFVLLMFFPPFSSRI